MKRATSQLHSPGPHPVLLTVPGLNNSGPSHWQSLWEVKRENCYRVELGMWDRPHRNTWLSKLDAAIATARAPVILIAHSLGCHAVAWWNQSAADDRLSKVAGALLVAPPWVGDLPEDSPLSSFAPLARERLAFPSILAASRNDPFAGFGQSQKMAPALGQPVRWSGLDGSHQRGVGARFVAVWGVSAGPTCMVPDETSVRSSRWPASQRPHPKL